MLNLFKILLYTIYNNAILFIKSNKLAFNLLLLSIIIGFVTRIYINFGESQAFLIDQAQNSFVHQDIAKGKLITFGPKSSIGLYGIPSGYYYWMFLFSFFTSDPSYHHLSNMITSFLTIPLLFLVVIRVFWNSKYKYIVGSIASLMYSMVTAEMIFASITWNPNALTFFWLILVLLLDYSRSVKSFKNLLIIWFGVGFVVGMLISLHSSSLFIIPFLGVANILYFYHRTKSLTFLASFLGFAFVTFPYFWSEFNTKWANTNLIFRTLLEKASTPKTFLERIDHLYTPLKAISEGVLFPSFSLPNITAFFVFFCFSFGLFLYKGSKFYLINYLALFVLITIASNSYYGIQSPYYYLLIWSLPFVLICSIIVHILDNFAKISSKILTVVTFLFVILFVAGNFNFFGTLYREKFTEERLPRISELKTALTYFDNNSSVCSEIHYLSLDYLNSVGPKKNIKFTALCDASSTSAFIYKPPSYNYVNLNDNNIDKTKKLIELTRSILPKTVFETNQLIILGKNKLSQKSINEALAYLPNNSNVCSEEHFEDLTASNQIRDMSNGTIQKIKSLTITQLCNPESNYSIISKIYGSNNEILESNAKFINLTKTILPKTAFENQDYIILTK